MSVACYCAADIKINDMIANCYFKKLEYIKETRTINFSVVYDHEQDHLNLTPTFSFQMNHNQFRSRYNYILEASEKYQLMMDDDSEYLDHDFDLDFKHRNNMIAFFINNAPIIAEIHTMELFHILGMNQKTFIHKYFDDLLLRELKSFT